MIDWVLFVGFFLMLIAMVLLAFSTRSLKKRVENYESRLCTAEEGYDRFVNHICDVNEKISEISRQANKTDSEHRHDSRLLSKEISSLAEEFSMLVETVRQLDEKVSDAYEVAEAQAKNEQRIFDGLTSIMDYGVETARKAVSGDAE